MCHPLSEIPLEQHDAIFSERYAIRRKFPRTTRRMVPPLLFDLSAIDLNHVQHGVADVERVNPHRGQMRLLDGIIHTPPEKDRAVAFKDVRDDEFWVAGHIPGRPLMPGVLMIEAGAQLASFVYLSRMPEVKFLGFSGVDDVKFRGQVGAGGSAGAAGIRRSSSARVGSSARGRGWCGGRQCLRGRLSGCRFS